MKLFLLVLAGYRQICAAVGFSQLCLEIPLQERAKIELKVDENSKNFLFLLVRAELSWRKSVKYSLHCHQTVRVQVPLLVYQVDESPK